MLMNLNSYRAVCVLATVSLMVIGCADSSLSSGADGAKKEKTGTAVGAVLGGAAGAAVSKNKGTGVVVGALLGALIGNRIGAKLDERDQLALAAKIQEAASQAQIGEKVTWNSDHSGASAEITPISETNREKAVAVTLNEARGSRYASSSLNIRSGPGLSYAVVETLPSGTKVSLHGVTEEGWYRINRAGKDIGYVFGQYLAERPVAVSAAGQAEPQSKSNPRPIENTQASSKGKSEEITVMANVKCRDVRIQRKVDGKLTETTATTCQSPDGSWGA